MPKRSRVPTTLHSELEEYVSLVRAIRTSKTLDLSSHLTQYSQTHRSASASSQQSEYEDDSGEEEIDELNESQYDTENGDLIPREEGENGIDSGDVVGTPSRQNGKAVVRIKTRRKAKAVAFNERDVWTRWPLLSGDVHVPAWGLDDEIAVLSIHIMRAQRDMERVGEQLNTGEAQTSPDLRVSPEPLDPTLETEEEKGHIPHLAASASHTLSRLLMRLAQYVPQVEKSARNRLAPLDWNAVLQAAEEGEFGLSAGLSGRLQAMYGPRDSTMGCVDEHAEPSPTYRGRADRTVRLSALGGEGDLFTFFGPHSSGRPSKIQTKGKRQKRKETYDSEQANQEHPATEPQ